MAEVSAGMVRELREKTDAPMMECKKALTEAGGDMDKAEEILRVKLGNKATKASGRVTAEGVVAVHIGADGKLGAIVEVNCETDFVAKNDEFLAFAQNVAGLVARDTPADVAQLSQLPLDGSTVDTRRTALVGKIGENISIRRFQRHEAKGKLTSYIHGGAKIGVIVDVVGGDDALAKDLAIAAAKASESGKPANIVEKMVEGAVAKFLKEVTLLGQPFVKNDKQTVESLLKSKGAAVNAFVLYVVGEGIEKKTSDFAAEVAAQAKQAEKTH